MPKQKVEHAWKDTDIIPIENPMRMSYREAYAWQLGFEKGWEAKGDEKR